MAITKILTINDCGRKFAGRHLQTAITYIIDPNKTQNMRYVTGINCQPEKAFDQMLATKQKFGKTDKRQGYHIIISFEEEDVEPGTAFEIIRKFAEEYLGQGYEAIYAVHDNTAHTHGHIIFNSVNGITGRKYRYEKGDWAKVIQPITNRLCEEYGLATMEIEMAGQHKNEYYKDWNEFRDGKLICCLDTPYVNKQVLPEVVYAYGLNESIAHGYLKDADPIGFENVKNEEFLRTSITKFWERYGGKTYEGLLPKLAIFAANVKEATDTVRPAVEKVLSELGISLSTVLVNTGDPSVTKDEDIKNFNNLDVIGTEGSKKQFIILVEKGREGWNCRSLLGIALFRSPKSKVFVLQATMRCLRQITKEQLKATVFLSKENYDILDDELRKNYNMEISDFGKSPNTNKKVYKVRVLPPPRSIKMKRLWHEYSLIEKEYSAPVDFHLAELDEAKYEAKMYEKGSLRLGLSEKKTNIDSMKEQERFSEFSLTAEISRYMNISCLTVAKILRESVDGSNYIVEAVNRHNEILEDVIIPKIFHTLYEVRSTQKSEDVDMVLLREPKDAGYYEFSANDELVITKGHNNLTPEEEAKSFHADTYCFDSKPERECFLQYISSNKVKEIYFTGMFTSNQGDLSVQYFDPESKRLRKYYPDFLARMEDGSYQLIEVKGDNKIDDEVVLAKKAAAEEMAVASGVRYLMYAGSILMKNNVLETTEYENASIFEDKNTSIIHSE